MSVSSISQANHYSRYPILQQGIGAATVVSNVFKFAKDVIERTLHCALDALKYLGNCLGCSKEKSTKKSTTAKSWSYEENFANMKEHVKFIGIGILRMIPIVGTFVSVQYCKDSKKVSDASVSEGTPVKDSSELGNDAENVGNSTSATPDKEVI